MCGVGVKKIFQIFVCWDIVYEGGIKKFKKDCPTYREVGKYKAEWAEKIGDFFDIDNNKSPSFQHFIYEIQHRLETA